MTPVIACLVVIMGVMIWKMKGGARLVSDLGVASRQAAQLLPRIAMIIVLAGFVVALLPPGLVADLMGPRSGWVGVLYAAALGALIPGGASITFSIVVVLAEAGTGPVQLVTLLTSWSVFALHRVFIFEIPLMGLQFAMTRLLVSLPLPFIAAGISALLFEMLGI